MVGLTRAINAESTFCGAQPSSFWSLICEHVLHVVACEPVIIRKKEDRPEAADHSRSKMRN